MVIKQYLTTREELNKWGVETFNNAYKYFVNMAKDENESVLKIFNDWWNGERVYSEEYMSKFSPEDHDKADGIIMTAISNGFG